MDGGRMSNTCGKIINNPVLNRNESFIYFGTQAVGQGKGISVARFDSLSGEITKPELSVETQAPAYFVFHPNGRYVYVCNSNNFSCGWFSETISAFSINANNGRLTLLNQQQSGGRDPNYLCLDEDARHLLVANYKGGNISTIEINPDGSLGRTTSFFQHYGSSINPERQTQPYAHCIKLDAASTFALVADLGVDKIFVYRFNMNDGSLQPHDPPYASVVPGSGPRHMVFRPDNRFVYITNEMAHSISVFSWDQLNGILSEVQTVEMLPDGVEGVNLAGDIIIHPDGKYLFAACRGHDSVSMFSIDEHTGKIVLVDNVFACGQKPRNLAIDPTNQWLIVSNQASDNVHVYRIDEKNGHLVPKEKTVAVPNPLGIGFLRNNR
jgi:6-phosphogluconolactonase